MECPSQFGGWIKKKLRELNTDEVVFGSYITGILDDDGTNDEKRETLVGILSEIIEGNVEGIVTEIIDEWKKSQPQPGNSTEGRLNDDDVDKKLAKLLESQKVPSVVQRQYTEDELRIREQILSQYSQLSGDEEDDEVAGAGAVVVDKEPSDLMKNTNVQDVQALLKEKREQSRLESQRKKDKDKEDREKQRQAREDKKEKRKTVKGERRR